MYLLYIPSTVYALTTGGNGLFPRREPSQQPAHTGTLLYTPIHTIHTIHTIYTIHTIHTIHTIQDTYMTIERMNADGSSTVYARDGDWSTTFSWAKVRSSETATALLEMERKGGAEAEALKKVKHLKVDGWSGESETTLTYTVRRYIGRVR